MQFSLSAEQAKITLATERTRGVPKGVTNFAIKYTVLYNIQNICCRADTYWSESWWNKDVTGSVDTDSKSNPDRIQEGPKYPSKKAEKGEISYFEKIRLPSQKGCRFLLMLGSLSLRSEKKYISYYHIKLHGMVHCTKKVSGFSRPKPGNHLHNSQWQGIIKYSRPGRVW
jgi:hypothetical protein